MESIKLNFSYLYDQKEVVIALFTGSFILLFDFGKDLLTSFSRTNFIFFLISLIILFYSYFHYCYLRSVEDDLDLIKKRNSEKHEHLS